MISSFAMTNSVHPTMPIHTDERQTFKLVICQSKSKPNS